MFDVLVASHATMDACIVSSLIDVAEPRRLHRVYHANLHAEPIPPLYRLLYRAVLTQSCLSLGLAAPR